LYEMGLIVKESPQLQVYAKHAAGAPITFLTGATPSERMRIDSSGQVGIGTVSPNATLKVQGPVDTATLSTSSTPAARINNGGAISNWIGANGYNYGYIQSIQDDGTNNLKPLALQPLGGNVGIGTASPSGNLHVDGGEVFFSSTGNSKLQIKAGNTSSSFIEFGDPDDGNVGRLLYGHSDNSMQFTVNASEAMRIDSSGNVGIGTSSPATKLEVQRSGAGNVASFNDGTYGADIAATSTGGVLQTYNINQTLDFKVFNSGYMRFF